MTRLTKAIKTDIKDLIRDKAINPKELALEAKKREFLLKVFGDKSLNMNTKHGKCYLKLCIKL